MKSRVRATGTIGIVIAAMFALLGNPVVAQESTPAVEQPVTIGQTEVTWADAWEYDYESSLEDQLTLMRVDEEAGTVALATYGEIVDDTVDGAEAALDTYATAYFEGADMDVVTARDAGELERGAIWKVYDFELNDDTPFTVVITVSESTDGAFIISALTGNADAFAQIVQQAQDDIALNDDPVFLEGVDGESLISPVASPAATPED